MLLYGMTRLQVKRILERLGFGDVRGWVGNEDAPKVRKLIAAAKEDVEKVKNGTGPEHES